VGLLRDGWALSYEQTFWTAGFVMIVPLLLLALIKAEEVDQAKRRLG